MGKGMGYLLKMKIEGGEVRRMGTVSPGQSKVFVVHNAGRMISGPYGSSIRGVGAA